MPEKILKVLVISGGGVFGIIPSHFLSLTKPEDFEKVDAIAGTSVGGILSLCYASGKTGKETKDLFKEAVPHIFKRNWLRRLLPRRSMYSSTEIEKFLKNAIPGTAKDCPKKFIVPCMNFKKKKPVIFHNFNNSYSNYPLWKIGRSTSAAPTYFEPFSENILIDGGIIENVPIGTMFSVLWKYLKVDKHQLDVFVVGTGTNYPNDDISLKKVKRYTLIQWALELLPVLTTKANEMLSITMGENFGFRSFHYFNPVTINGALDDVEQVQDGSLEEACEIYNSQFLCEWEKFLNQ